MTCPHHHEWTPGSVSVRVLPGAGPDGRGRLVLGMVLADGCYGEFAVNATTARQLAAQVRRGANRLDATRTT